MGVVNTAIDGKGGLPVITNQLVGHVDNSSYLLTSVDIHSSLSTPANAWGDYGSLGAESCRDGAVRAAGPEATGPTWQQRVPAKGRSYCHHQPHWY
jgi:hypothetical protein